MNREFKRGLLYSKVSLIFQYKMIKPYLEPMANGLLGVDSPYAQHQFIMFAKGVPQRFILIKNSRDRCLFSIIKSNVKIMFFVNLCNMIQMKIR